MIQLSSFHVIYSLPIACGSEYFDAIFLCFEIFTDHIINLKIQGFTVKYVSQGHNCNFIMLRHSDSKNYYFRTFIKAS